MALAMRHHQEGRLREAADGYVGVLAEDRCQHAARHNLGMARLGLNELASGLALLGQAFAEDGGNPAWAQSLPVIGMTLYRQGQWEAAGPWLERAVLCNPGDQTLAAALERVSARDYLQAEIYDERLGRTLKRHTPREATSYVYAVDVVGTCNLRCPTCPVGNSPAALRAKGFMDVALFRRVLAKILADGAAARPEVWLFNWGEPLLHPQIGEIIRLVREAGLSCHLSTNLNVERGIAEVAQANPDNLKISLSGFTAETYGKTHVKGDITLVKANMYLLRHYLDKFKATTRVWVGHHLYRNNQHELAAVAAVCQELGFEHHPLAAFYQPLERLVDLLEGKGAPAPILDDLLEHPRSYLPRIKDSRSGNFDCELRFNQTAINFDGTVALCCSVYDEPNMLGAQFLEHGHAALQAMKYGHPFCETCIHHGLAYMPPEIF
jgi:organic radical activating enzyme